MAETKLHDRLLGTKYAKNILYNGGFEICPNGAGPFTGGVGPDRWQVFTVGGSGGQVDMIPNAGSGPYRSEKYAKMTAPDGGYVVLRQDIEGAANYQSMTVSFSVWVSLQNGLSGVRIEIYDKTGAGEDFTATDYFTGSGWTQLTVTRTLRADLIDYGFNVAIRTESGVSPGQYVAVDSAMLVIGDQPVHFLPNPILGTEPIYARYGCSTVSNYQNKPYDFEDVQFDSHSAVTTGADWKFTAPAAGMYLCTVTLAPAGTHEYGYLRVNGVQNWGRVGYFELSIFSTTGTGFVYLNKGDYVQFYGQSGGGGATTSGDDNRDFISIVRLN